MVIHYTADSLQPVVVMLESADWLIGASETWFPEFPSRSMSSIAELDRLLGLRLNRTLPVGYTAHDRWRVEIRRDASSGVERVRVLLRETGVTVTSFLEDHVIDCMMRGLYGWNPDQIVAFDGERYHLSEFYGNSFLGVIRGEGS